MTRLALRSQRVLLPDGRGAPATVLVEGDRIADVLAVDASLDDWPMEDLGGRWLLPGLVDTHVHLNEPGRTEWEGFASATAAAAAGGVTTLVDMPLNCIPATTSVAALTAKRAAADGQLHVDVGFFGGVVPGNGDALGPLMDAGVLGFKAFLIESGVDEFPQVAEGDLRAALPQLASRGVPLLAHCELELETPAPTGSGPASYGAFLASRPKRWEEAAIALLCRLGEETGCPVHVVHLSAATALPLIAEARERGARVSVETCPHYLYFEAERIPDGDGRFKCAPPIRERDNRAALLAALRDGAIDLLVSDHSPCTPALKKLAERDLAGAWGGIASLQVGIRACLTAAAAVNLGVPEVARRMSATPADFAGLADRKGRIARGLDADLCVFDDGVQDAVRGDQLLHRHGLTPYDGDVLRGRVERTYLRGQLVFDGAALVGKARGRMLEGRA